MHIFSVNIDEFIFTRCPYSNVSAVNCADYIWKTGHCCKLPFDVGLFTHSVRKPDVLTGHVYNAIQNGWNYAAEGRL